MKHPWNREGQGAEFDSSTPAGSVPPSPGTLQIRLSGQDPFLLPVEAVICQAGGDLEHWMDRALDHATDQELQNISRLLEGTIVTEARLVPSGLPRIPWVIFVAGPKPEQPGAQQLLKKTYLNALDRAREQGLHRLAFTPISLDRYGYPAEEIALAAGEACSAWAQQHPEYVLELTFACEHPTLYKIFSEVLADQKEDLWASIP